MRREDGGRITRTSRAWYVRCQDPAVSMLTPLALPDATEQAEFCEQRWGDRCGPHEVVPGRKAVRGYE